MFNYCVIFFFFLLSSLYIRSPSNVILAVTGQGPFKKCTGVTRSVEIYITVPLHALFREDIPVGTRLILFTGLFHLLLTLNK
jgi:hypothetical protein